jgi:hypothetical protein
MVRFPYAKCMLLWNMRVSESCSRKLWTHTWCWLQIRDSDKLIITCKTGAIVVCHETYFQELHDEYIIIIIIIIIISAT